MAKEIKYGAEARAALDSYDEDGFVDKCCEEQVY